ncbi:protein adenylyltransferase Fic [Synechococcus sp. PCC 6312]|uniref:protein adenylyltransferase Fic n=1 Tax=Synechococcus sp. (strain ATCC 27167 / PCC 6312) TaxID=195253 RepID=UPI00029F3C7C|nr:Fic family protein [Synechococcus sp. PCC 6312]AFY61891.1 hypothetical protein Syn6312_2815 [Synechococcus sp. PCC 6312]
MGNFSPDTPYNGLPLLPPPSPVETHDILKRCIEARAALAELKQSGELIPNQAMLINTLPVLEAQASSAIENIVTTADRLFQFAQVSPERADSATKEALRYGKALRSGYLAVQKRPLTTQTAIEVCSAIKGVEMEIRATPGVALINDRTQEIIYTPPVGGSILHEKLYNWQQFIHNSTEIDPLIRMAIMHYQFEAIHPFTDGNGRTGRILNLLYLVEQGLLNLPILYLSRYIIHHKTEYYTLLLRVTTNQDWQAWIIFMLTAIQETATWTTAKIQAIRDLMQLTANYVQKQESRIYSRELIEIIFTQPYCRIINLVEVNLAQRQTASDYLKRLVNIGVLEEFKSGREKLFIHPRFVKLLTDDGNEIKPY